MAKNKSPKTETPPSEPATYERGNSETAPRSGAELAALAGANPAMVIVDGKDISPEDRERILAEAKTHLPTIEVMHLHSEDERNALERLRSLARRNETLAQAVDRLSFDKGVLLGAQEAAMSSNPLRALEGHGRVVGVIVEDVEEGKHRVHVLERNADGALVLWAVERGEVMPWHAARAVVDKIVETRLTPEDKR